MIAGVGEVDIFERSRFGQEDYRVLKGISGDYYRPGCSGRQQGKFWADGMMPNVAYDVEKISVPYGIRTRAAALKGLCPRPG